MSYIRQFSLILVMSCVRRGTSEHFRRLKNIYSDQTDRVTYIFYFLYGCNIIFYITYLFSKEIVGWERLQRNSRV